MKYDVAIIGAGPGGYVAAIRASQLGMKVALIEKNQTLGGTCLNVGCIPSKSLLQATEDYERVLEQADNLGLVFKDFSFDFSKMMAKKEEVVSSLVKGVSGLMRKNKIDVFHGSAKLVSPHEISVGNDTIDAENIILATGSESIELPFLPFDEEKIVSSTGALSLKKLPKKLVVIGGGVIGVELASVYRRLGSEVTVVEMLDQICTPLDRGVAKQFHRILEKQGIKFLLKTSVTGGDVVKNGVILQIAGEELEADVVLVAVGRRPYSADLGLENVGIETDERGFIPVNDHFATKVPSIYAIGDLIPGAMLAHRASEEGVVLAEFLAGKKPKIDYSTIPNVIYTYPEVATVGFTEEEAKAMGADVMIGNFSLLGNARARTSRAQEGFIKLIGDKKTGLILGVHIVTPHASEMIGEAVLAIRKRTTVEELASLPHAHPTLLESLKEAALNALGRTLHA